MGTALQCLECPRQRIDGVDEVELDVEIRAGLGACLTSDPRSSAADPAHDVAHPLLAFARDRSH